jgi:hypothetical protein
MIDTENFCGGVVLGGCSERMALFPIRQPAEVSGLA